MKQELIRLLNTEAVRKRVISLLKTMGLIQEKLSSYHGLQLTDKAHSLLKQDLITPEVVETFITIFPPGWRSDKKTVREKMTRFLREYPQYIVQDIYEAADFWVKSKKQYCGNAKYFFYKKEKDGVESSRCLETLEYLKENSYIPDENII